MTNRARSTPASVAEYRAQRAAEMTEDELLSAVRALAKAEGWRCYHTYRSDRSEPGWPDLVLVRGSVLLIRELKTERGRTTEAQSAWVRALAEANVDVDIWRPSDLFERRIERILQGRP